MRRSRSATLSARLALASLGTARRRRRRLRRRSLLAGERLGGGAGGGQPAAGAHRRRRGDERLPLSKRVRRRVSAHRQPGLAGRAGEQPPRLRVVAPPHARQGRRAPTRSACSTRFSPSTPPTIGRAARRSPSTTPATPRRRRRRSCRTTPRRSGCAICSPSSAGRPAPTPRRRWPGPSDRFAGWPTCWSGPASPARVASLLVGFLWARRITKPITELEVQVESAAERTRIHLLPGAPASRRSAIR